MTKKTQRARAAAVQRPRLGDARIRPDGSLIRCVREEDDEHKPVDHYRTVDTLALMLGSGSITGAMHEAGLQLSIRDWALRDGWNGKRVEKNEAKGILVAALGVLARYYGYERAGSHSRIARRTGA